MSDNNSTKDILKQAIGLDTEARTLLLDSIENTSTRTHVETLLADPEKLNRYLQDSKQANHQSRIEPGTKIKRIRVDSLLGEGGMGSVYLGFDEKLERKVAIKAIRPEHLKNPATQQRFVREAQIMSKINHPAICQLYDYIEDEMGDFLVMEFIDGQPLYKTAMTDTQKLLVLKDLVAALEVAHEFGIVHRDLKPDNIMITGDGKVKVLDFGIAQSMNKPSIKSTEGGYSDSQNLTQQGSLVGTIRYMSPEQAQGQSINTASDIYAVGIIAQELFSHKAAYAVMETEQLLTDVQQGKRLHVTDLPPTIARLVNDLTQLSPDSRPSASETKHQIQAIINAPKIKRQRFIKGTIATLVVVFILALLYQWQTIGDQAERNQIVKDYENQIEQIIKQSEQIYVLPIHPVTNEISQLLKEGEQLYNEIESNNSLTSEEKLRLQGIILLKAEYYEDAIPFLEQGNAESNLMAAVWTQLYIEKATEKADLYGLEKTMQDTELRENYLQPALNFINQAEQETGEKDPLFEAFVLSQVDSLESGLVAVDQVLADEQWNKEAVKLKALILSAMMQSAKEAGAWETAQKYGQMTVETYEISAEMARSYPPSYQNLCYHQLNLMADAIQRTGEKVNHHAERSIEACENALVTLPEDNYAKRLLARTYLLLAQWQLNQGQSGDDSIQLAKQWNEQINTLNNVYVYSWSKALILTIQAKSGMLKGKNTLPTLNEALNVFEGLIQIESEFRPYLIGDYLFALAQKAEWLVANGADIESLKDQAKTLFDQTILTPDLMVSEQLGLVTNMAEIHWISLMNQKLNDIDIESSTNDLLAFLQPSENVIKNEPFHLIRLADTHALMTEHLWQKNQQIGTHLEQAKFYIGQALEVNSTSYPILISQANIMSLKAAVSGTNFNQANELFEQARNLNLNDPYGLKAHSEHWLRQARANHSNQSEALKNASRLINKAIEIQPENLFLLKTAEEIKSLTTELSYN